LDNEPQSWYPLLYAPPKEVEAPIPPNDPCYPPLLTMTANAPKLFLMITSISPPQCVFRNNLTRKLHAAPYKKVVAEARVKTRNHPPIANNNSLFPIRKTKLTEYNCVAKISEKEKEDGCNRGRQKP